MTTKEAIALDCCPECGYRLMRVPQTGLVACLSCLDYKECNWHVRVTPWEEKKFRKDSMTQKEKKLAEMQAEIDRRKEEWGD